ncbi:MAG: hypothetical protein HZY79_15490 [Rhodoblastus sp.]|nr:MAG: hypothetical protein HZY79_15490 [Rhodoblastus sp.]
MTTLDVSLRLGLVNAISKGAGDARKEVEKLAATARKAARGAMVCRRR